MERMEHYFAPEIILGIQRSGACEGERRGCNSTARQCKIGGEYGIPPKNAIMIDISAPELGIIAKSGGDEGKNERMPPKAKFVPQLEK